MISIYPSSKFKNVTPSANKLTFNGVELSSKAVKLSVAGTITCENEIGDSVVVPIGEHQVLPIVTAKITAVSGGTLTVFFE